MEHRIVERPAFKVVGLKEHHQPGSDDIPKLWDQFVPRMDEVKHLAEPRIYYGIMGNYNHETGFFDYMAARPVTSTEDIPQDMESWSIPAGKYAVFTTCLKTLHEDNRTIYNTWLPASGHGHADAPDFELYDERFQDGKEDPFEIYVAIT